ncbi:hypothetical protein LYSHEL_22460 [Lysobacter helvus]|uniref:Potassium channel domain-containing protein n=2 Tax=Lysobacteraceae TaxID=32033 RepID=A0ABN6G087_9GAMM|nr:MULTISPECIES: potassium channel family protein [Lysobacter]BCT93223.1 hypothetical protein LYSCAS_22470 [Lysobacter caseinilyticus]BCT96375.1 hypothetical protein LYSHEL_22460 [Lysobacter helvus]
MLRAILTGFPVLVLCVALQAMFVSASLRGYAYFQANPRRTPITQWSYVRALSAVMLLMLLGNFLQMAAWAVLFLLLGEFNDYSTALYHSAVNFSTLGYGDIVMSPRWRLLGPVEAANGILMFGVSTAVMTAAVIDQLKFSRAKNPKNAPP